MSDTTGQCPANTLKLRHNYSERKGDKSLLSSSLMTFIEEMP